MKKHLLFFIFTLIFNSLNAQQILQQVTNTYGNSFSSTNFSISSNIGQSITSTLTSGNAILTQGFLQPFTFDIPTFLVQPNLDNNFVVYPTLTSEGIFYELHDKTLIVKGIEVYDSEGRIVLRQEGYVTYISLANLPNGAYWLRPLVDNKVFGIKKVIKV